MDTVYFSTSARSLSARFVDEEFSIKSTRHIIESTNISIHKPAALQDVKAANINNYSALFLSKKIRGSDILNFNNISNIINNIVTPIYIDNCEGDVESRKYIYISESTSDFSKDTYPCLVKQDDSISDESRKYFEINLINSIFCRVSHQSKNNIFYLTVNQDDKLMFNKQVVVEGIPTTIDDTLFEYYIDNNTLTLVKLISGVEGEYRKTVSVVNDQLTLTNYNSSGGSILFNSTTKFSIDNINIIQDIHPKIDTSWVSYKDFNNKIDNSRSIFNQSTNYFLSTQYSNITGDYIELNMLPLKNALSNDNTIMRGDYMTQYNSEKIPNVDLRSYEGMQTGSFEEKGNTDISFTYTYYNQNFKFYPDTYNTFTTPKSLYPYTQININDTLFARCGSFPGDSPHTADRLYTANEGVMPGAATGEYLCTWLSGGGGGASVWLDRYYIPEAINKFNALSSSAVSHGYFSSLGETIKAENNLDEYFDIKSTLAIIPDSKYIYQRIGSTYIKQFLEHLDDEIILDRLQLKSSRGGLQPAISDDDVDSNIYNLDNSYYLTNDNELINRNSELTMSFWLRRLDWKKSINHQILGSYNNRGISVTNDEAITPFVAVQSESKQSIDIYNTNGRRLHTVRPIRTSSNREKIIDLIRTDHLDDMYAITDSFNIYKIQSNGPIYSSKKLTEITGYINYYNFGGKLYILENEEGRVVELDLHTEEVTILDPVIIPEESGEVYKIRSISMDINGNIVGFRGDKTIKFNDLYALTLIENVTLALESYDHSSRQILLKNNNTLNSFTLSRQGIVLPPTPLSGVAIKDFAVFDNNIFIIKGESLIKMRDNGTTVYNLPLFAGAPLAENESRNAIAVDIVREYINGELYEYPIVIANSTISEKKQNNYLIKILEDSVGNPLVESVSIETNVVFNSKCDGSSYRYNLTNFKYLQDQIDEKNQLHFNFKIDNTRNSTDKLIAKFNYDLEEFLPGSKHHFAIRVDTKRGTITLFIDSHQVEQYIFNPAKYNIESLLTDGLCVGGTNFFNNLLLADYIKMPGSYLCRGLQMEQPKFYATAVDDIDIKFLYYNNIDMPNLTVSLPAGENNQMETIKAYYKWQGAPSKSNDINIIIKGELLEDLPDSNLKEAIVLDITKTLPASVNIKNIEFKSY